MSSTNWLGKVEGLGGGLTRQEGGAGAAYYVDFHLYRFKVPCETGFK